MTTIGLCLQLHRNMIPQFKNIFTSFKRCWDKQRPVFISISEEQFKLYSLSLNELMPDINVVFQIQTQIIIENLILTPPHNEEQLTFQIIDFDGLVQTVNNIDNNAEDVRFYLEQQQELILFGCEIIKQDETKIQRFFETKITANKKIDVFFSLQITSLISSSLAQMFNFAHKFESSLKIQFFELSNMKQALKLSLTSDQQPNITQFIVPSGTNIENMIATNETQFVVNHMFCQKANEICSLEEIIQISQNQSKLILSYFKEGITKQFVIPEIQIENDHRKIEYQGLLQ